MYTFEVLKEKLRIFASERMKSSKSDVNKDIENTPKVASDFTIAFGSCNKQNVEKLD